MYDFIAGEVAHKSPTSVVLDVGGVGYDIRVPLSTYEALPDRGGARLYTHLHVRDDALILYGFATEAERDGFRRLISVRGIGPGLAVTVLSGIRVPDFCQAVARGDAGMLARIKGIGRKIAERIVVDLKDTIAEWAPSDQAGAARHEPVSDLITALIGLGYSRAEAQKAAAKALDDLGADTPVEQLLRAALRKG